MLIFPEPYHFEWDRGNRDKNFIKHQVTLEECEEVFYDPHKRMLKVGRHECPEDRYLLLARTAGGRLLFVVFTLRKQKIRVISARDLNKKEKSLYEKGDPAS